MQDNNSTDLSHILNGGPNEAPEQAPTTEAAPNAEDATATVQVAAEKPADQPTQEAPEPMVPLSVLKAVRAELRDERQQRAEPQTPPPPAQQAPDMFEDPDGYRAYLEHMAANRSRDMFLNMSEEIVREQHGAENVDAALEAAKEAGGHVFDSIANSRSPWHALMRWHATEKARAEIGDPAQYRARLEAEIRAKIEAETKAKALSAPPPSFASETSVTAPGGRPTGPSLHDIIGPGG